MSFQKHEVKLIVDRKAIAQSTLAALDKGAYSGPDGQDVPIAARVEACVTGTQFFDPELLATIRDAVLAQPQPFASMSIELVNETTLQCTQRLSMQEQYGRICALNFASARNPGGGFLGGARAQEESLARSSGLYPSLLRYFEEFYAFHRNERSTLYSDRMMYSPQCPIFRDDAGQWLAQPYTVDIITSPAPNAGAIMHNEPAQSKHIIPVFAERARKVLALAAHMQCDTLILGAWGCGAFRNDPKAVANIFFQLLCSDGAFSQRFQHVVFAIYDSSRTQEIYTAFANQLASLL